MSTHHPTKAELEVLASEIDQLIRQQPWFDFQITAYNGHELTIVGSVDLTYYHTLEVTFHDVFFASAFFQGWHSNTATNVFGLPADERELNQQHEIEQGYHLFVFRTEDYRNNIIIAATAISYSTVPVRYGNLPEFSSEP